MIDPNDYARALLIFLLVVLVLAVPVLLLLAYRKTRRALADTADPVEVKGVWSRTDVEKYAQSKMGPGATFREVPRTESLREVYGIVSCPGHHRIISAYDRYAPGKGRKRIVQRLSDPTFVKSTKK